MANKYLRSGAGGAGTGADWANAYTTIAAAAAGMAAGDDLWVSEDHSESTAGAVSPAFPGTQASPNRILCVNHAGSVPPVSADLTTGAIIKTTGANSIMFTGSLFSQGLTLSAADTGGAVAAQIILCNTAQNQQVWKNTTLKQLGTTGAAFSLCAAQGSIVLDNPTFVLGSASHSLGCRGRIVMKNTSSTLISGATLPNSLFTANSAMTEVFCEGVDFSNLTSKTIVANFGGVPAEFWLKNCKLPATVTVNAAQTLGRGGAQVYVLNTDSGATNTRNEKHNYAGDETTETTIVRSGGASDGTTALAKKIVTSANASWQAPFDAMPMMVWNDTVGSSVTLTVYGIWGGGAVPNKEDIWIDVEYLGSSGTPVGSFATSGNADILATAANSSDASSWGGSTTAFKMAVTVTPQLKGPMFVYVRAAKASSTFYVDKKPVLT